MGRVYSRHILFSLIIVTDAFNNYTCPILVDFEVRIFETNIEREREREIEREIERKRSRERSRDRDQERDRERN